MGNGNMKRCLTVFMLLITFCFAGCEVNEPLMTTPAQSAGVPVPGTSTPTPITTALVPAETKATESTKPVATVIPTQSVVTVPAQPPVTVPAETAPATVRQTTVPATVPHQHAYQPAGGKEPTCMENGTMSYACSCGASYTDTVLFLGHRWDSWAVSREPTETQEGEGYYLCTRCGAKEVSSIPKLEKKLTNDDWQEIARLTLQYINDIRNSQGACSAVEMPGCTQYAKLRSQQMADKEKVEHSYADSLAAANQLQYGRYIDPALYGMEGEPYYQVYGGEAVGNGYGKTVEEVARCLADGVSDSPQHWTYVGADKNGYMSIGVTRNNGWWYCCIITSPVNLDENPLGY